MGHCPRFKLYVTPLCGRSTSLGLVLSVVVVTLAGTVGTMTDDAVHSASSVSISFTGGLGKALTSACALLAVRLNK
ncbi:hypothetical protein BDR07DRAFT_1425538 [Suillus spraguei]|nr:hypothetical protein BDR07DRAFT_1425538 [Suillus spraguei]